MEKTPVSHDNDLDIACDKGSFDVDPETDSDTQCGIGPLKPRCLQVFSNMITFTLYYGVTSLVTTALAVYLTSQVTTLEKQFGLSSSETGMLLSMNDFGFLIFVLIISHFSRYAHKPRILGICVFVFGCSAIVSAIPHFVSPTPQLDESNMTYVNRGMSPSFRIDSFSGESLCSPSTPIPTRRHANQTSTPEQICSETEFNDQTTTKFLALGIISAGMFFQGIAKSPRMAMSQTYIDDNVIKTKTGLHIGVLACLSLFGPAAAFAIGAKISTIYVTLQDTKLSTKDPRWIGAWWLGFMVFGFAALILSGPLFLFPRRMVIKSKNLQKQRQARQIQLQQQETLELVAKVKDLPLSLWRLATNFTYILMLIAFTLEVFSTAGAMSFAPKFFEVYFGLSVYKANMLLGTTTMIAASVGLLVGGTLTTKLKLNLMGCIKLTLLCQVASCITGSVPLFLDCPHPHIIGLENDGYLNVLPVKSFLTDGSCLDCACQGTSFFPVCGSDGRNYFSPCLAGCSNKVGYEYTNCTCVSNVTITSSSGNYSDFTAMPGLCSAECDRLTVFIGSQIVWAFLTTLSSIPQSVAKLRSVSEKDKTLCVGLSAFTQSLFGWTLGPLLFGYIVDTCCSFWHTSCSNRGSCALYDGYDLRNKLFGIGVSGRAICSIIFTICLIHLICKSKGKENTQEDKNGTEAHSIEETEKILADRDDTLEPMKNSSL